MTTILEQRRIEAAVIKPLVEAFEQELGRGRAREILAGVIRQLAVQSGRDIAEEVGEASLAGLAKKYDRWAAGDALEMDVLEQSERAFDFNITRCRYADMYRELGLAELGYTLSCNRDEAFVEGYSPELELQRTQTIMEGAAFCDFRYRRRE
jgi:predicted ArsR family transcriptional regulator